MRTETTGLLKEAGRVMGVLGVKSVEDFQAKLSAVLVTIGKDHAANYVPDLKRMVEEGAAFADQGNDTN